MLGAALASLFVSWASAQSCSSAPITVLYPQEGWVMPAGSTGEWVMGSVGRPNAKFTINGVSVKPYRTGGFLAYLPVSPGTATFHMELAWEVGKTTATEKAVLNRSIYVSPAPQVFPATAPAAIDPASLQPAQDMEVSAGDWIAAQMRGTPGSQASFQISGRRQDVPMAEVRGAPGTYEGAYQTQPGDSFDSSALKFHLRTSRGSASAQSKGKVTVRSGIPLVGIVKSNEGALSLKNAPAEGSILFPPAGTRLLVTGRSGGEVKVRLSPSLEGWLPASALVFLPPGTLPPRAVLSLARTQAGPDSTSIVLNLGETAPFAMEASDDLTRLTVRLFYTKEHANWIVYDSKDDFVSHVRWRQEGSDTLAVVIQLSPRRRLWGWGAYWENGSLRVELRHPPVLSGQGPVLKGRTIILDPGHMPGPMPAPGAFGPCGLLEKDANLAIAKALEAMLKKAGAKPVLTRSGDDVVGLEERPRIAVERHGDIFISIHNNNIHDGANPFRVQHGYSVFYYHPHSLPLARALHAAYAREIPLADEDLRYGDLLVARMSEMPAVLIESAYMNYPEQEDLLRKPSFQNRLAAAMLHGIQRFLEAERKRQQAR